MLALLLGDAGTGCLLLVVLPLPLLIRCAALLSASRKTVLM